MKLSHKVIITVLVALMAVVAFSGVGYAYTAVTVNSGNTSTSEYELLTQQNYTFGNSSFEYFSQFDNSKGVLKPSYYITDGEDKHLTSMRIKIDGKWNYYSFFPMGSSSILANHVGGIASDGIRYIESSDDNYEITGVGIGSTATVVSIEDDKVGFKCVGNESADYKVVVDVRRTSGSNDYCYIESYEGCGYEIVGCDGGISSASNVNTEIVDGKNAVKFKCQYTTQDYSVAIVIKITAIKATYEIRSSTHGQSYDITGYDGETITNYANGKGTTSDAIRPYLSYDELNKKVSFKCPVIDYKLVLQVKRTGGDSSTKMYLESREDYEITGISSLGSNSPSATEIKFEPYFSEKVGNVKYEYYNRVSFKCDELNTLYYVAINVKVSVATITINTPDKQLTDPVKNKNDHGFTYFKDGWRYLLQIYPSDGTNQQSILFWGKGNGWNRSESSGNGLIIEEGKEYIVKLYFGGPEVNMGTTENPCYVASYTTEPLGVWDNRTTLARDGTITYEYKSKRN